MRYVTVVSAALCSGCLMFLSTPGQDLSILAWIALTPLFLALRESSPAGSFWLAFTGGLAANAGIIHWVAIPKEVRIADFLLIAGYLGMWWGVFAATLAVVNKRYVLPLVITAPVLWVAIEYLRSHFFFLELPWMLLGHTQYRQTELIQIASVTGVYGISYLIVFVNAAIADALTSSRHCIANLVTALGLLTCSWLFGHSVLSGTAGGGASVPITVVPGNVPQAFRWDPVQQDMNLNRYVTQTRRALESMKTAMVVWPETSVPGQLRRDFKTVETLQALVNEGHTSLLIGSADREKFGQGSAHQRERYNSAFLFSPGARQLSSYFKMKLLPFGEYLPLPNAWFWPARYETQSSHYSPGHDYTVFRLSEQWESVPFAVSICWESIFPDHIRPFVQQGAQFLVSISNEAWFSGSAAVDQLFAMNVFRAVEYRRTLVRSVNGGQSGFIDPYGRILALTSPQLDLVQDRGYATHVIPISTYRTIYTEYGDLFVQVLVALSLVILCMPLLPKLLFCLQPRSPAIFKNT